MSGLYFDGSPEPDNFTFDFHDAVLAVAEKKGVKKVVVNFHDKEDYYNTMNLMQNFLDDRVTISSTSRKDDTSIVIEEAADLDNRS